MENNTPQDIKEALPGILGRAAEEANRSQKEIVEKSQTWQDRFEKIFIAQMSPTGYGLRYFFNTTTNHVLWTPEVAVQIEDQIKAFIAKEIQAAEKRMVTKLSVILWAANNCATDHKSQMRISSVLHKLGGEEAIQSYWMIQMPECPGIFNRALADLEELNA